MEVPSKEKFITYLNEIKNYIEYDNECRIAAEKHRIEFSAVDTSALSYLAIELLEIIFGFRQSDDYLFGPISYFCFELDFGNKLPGSYMEDFIKEYLTDENGNEIDISTAEKLYDYLIGREC